MTPSDELFILALDHRRSIESLYGTTQPPSDDERARIVDGKHLVFEALLAARSRCEGMAGIGILVDDDYGAVVAAEAKAAGLVLALSVERSGQAVFTFDHDDWRERLESVRPDFAKVLVRYHPAGDGAGNALQVERLKELSDHCASSGTSLLFELIVPFADADKAAIERDPSCVDELRSALIVTVMHVMHEAGIEPACWKVEGVADPAGARRIAAEAAADGRRAGVVVLGAGADDDTVVSWLRAGAVAGYQGFAVGRSIWAETLRAFDAGALTRFEAQERIADSYLFFVDAFRAAR